MKTIEIAYLRECLEYSANDGSFTWKRRPFAHFKTERDCNAWNTRLAGKPAGVRKKDGRIELTINDLKFRAHRVAWAMHHGHWPADMVDHRNRNPSDNSIDNLRECTARQNQQNRIESSTNSTGLKGACWFKEKGKFKAQIKINGKNKHLGLFLTAEEAHAAYCAAANENHRDFANFGTRGCNAN